MSEKVSKKPQITTAFVKKYLDDLEKIRKKVEKDGKGRIKVLVKKEFNDGEWVIGFGFIPTQRGNIIPALVVQNPVRAWNIPLRVVEQFLTIIDMYLDFDQELKLLTSVIEKYGVTVIGGRRVIVEEEEEEEKEEESKSEEEEKEEG